MLALEDAYLIPPWPAFANKSLTLALASYGTKTFYGGRHREIQDGRRPERSIATARFPGGKAQSTRGTTLTQPLFMGTPLGRGALSEIFFSNRILSLVNYFRTDERFRLVCRCEPLDRMVQILFNQKARIAARYRTDAMLASPILYLLSSHYDYPPVVYHGQDTPASILRGRSSDQMVSSWKLSVAREHWVHYGPWGS